MSKLMFSAARFTARLTPLASRIFPEKLEIDDNIAVWTAYTPDYTPGPPLRESIRADLAIIGGGFTGVSTAYHFSRRYPDKRVVLLEAKSLANGASGRNGGMMLNWVTDPLCYSSDEMIQRVYACTSTGIDTIIDIIQRHKLDVNYRRDGALEVYTSAQRAENAHAEAEYHNTLGIPVQYLDPQTLAEKLNLEGVYGAVLDPGTGQLNGAQYVRGLRPVLIEQGVEIYEQTPVIHIREDATITLTTPHGAVHAQAIVLATNGYTGKLGYFREALFPLHSHIFATAPLTQTQLDSIGWRGYTGYSDDYDRISYSSLTPDGRIIFGGGSNASYDYLFGNRTLYPGAPHSAKRGQSAIEHTLRKYQPGATDLPITHRWSGTLGITLKRNNLIGVRGAHRNIYYALGYCGHGVTLANIAGLVLTDLYSGDDEQWRGLPFYMAEYAPIPPEPFRWLGYQVFTRLTGKSPRV